MQSTLSSNNPLKTRRRLVRSLLTSAFFLGLSLFVTFNRQFILDSVHFWTYQPTAQISALAERAGLNDNGKFALYATQPSLESTQKFNDYCSRQEQGTAILGCYTNDRIYVYDVQDKRFDGIKEVTASHEMLHAVYQRMSDGDRARINELVEKEYQKLSKDPNFADRMAFYARTEPGERDNELHSIIGTEVTNISPELEQHYAKYFKNRSQVLTLFNGYNQLFLAVDRQTKLLSSQLDDLAKQIDTQMSAYNTTVKSLNVDIETFNQRAESGGFASQAAFNKERSALEKRVAALSDTREAVDAIVARYETLRKEYNDTVTASNNLYKSIDSTLAPAPSV